MGCAGSSNSSNSNTSICNKITHLVNCFVFENDEQLEHDT